MKTDTNSIVQRIKAGDTTCLEELVISYKSYCVNGLKKKVRCSDDEADGLFIDALLEIRDKILTDKVTHFVNLKSYIFGICQNMWLAQRREEKKLADKQNEVEIYYREYLQDDFLWDTDSSPDYKEELIGRVNIALGSIGDKCRMIIKYFYIEKRSMEDIAELLGFASSDVAKTSKSRCFKKLVDNVNAMEQK